MLAGREIAGVKAIWAASGTQDEFDKATDRGADTESSRYPAKPCMAQKEVKPT